jgi:hypothetical protein
LDLQSLETKKFKARDGVAEASTEYVRETLKNSGIEGSAKVVISDGGDHFFFSIVAQSRNKIYSNELRFKKRDLIGWPRDWQFGATMKLLTSFLRSIYQTEQRQETFAATEEEK